MGKHLMNMDHLRLLLSLKTHMVHHKLQFKLEIATDHHRPLQSATRDITITTTQSGNRPQLLLRNLMMVFLEVSLVAVFSQLSWARSLLLLLLVLLLCSWLLLSVLTSVLVEESLPDLSLS